METLEEKVAVITGAASGIGLAMARAFAGRGARVVLADIDTDGLAAAADELGSGGAEVVTQRCDVRLAEEVEALRDRALDAFGAVHVVCNNAGIGSGGPLEALTLNDWEWTLGVNLWGVIHGVRTFLPLLRAQDEGHIVNTASVAGLFGSPFMGPYTASKFAVVGLSEVLYHELAMTGSAVGVSVLCPSWVATRIHESERARPAELTNPGAGDADPAEAAGMRSLLEGVITSGMDPAAVADQVVAAVLERRFYLITHENSLPAIRARTDAMLAGDPPPFVMPQ